MRAAMLAGVGGLVRRGAASIVVSWAAAGLPAAALAEAGTPRPAPYAARVLAGLETGAADLPPPAAARLERFARDVSASWDGYDRRIGARMREWARAQVPPAPGATIFYPFSGPDFATVAQLYPDASRYVLVALQPAGEIPDLRALGDAELADYLQRFRAAWRQYAHLGFFRTNDLEEEARRPGLRIGTAATLAAFAERLGYRVESVQRMAVRSVGPAGADLVTAADGDAVRIRLLRDGRPVLLDYVRMNLANAHLRKDPAARAWIEGMAANPVVLKAASHLPQMAGFSIVSEAIVARATSVWQDETGIDHQRLAERFDVRLYGAFSRPHTLFNADRQASLARAYSREPAPGVIDFRVGYEKADGSSVQIAVRRSAPAAAAAVVSPAPVAAGAAAAYAARSQQAAASSAVATSVPAPAPGDPRAAALHARIASGIAEYRRLPRRMYVGGSPADPHQAAYLAVLRARLAARVGTGVEGPAQPALVALTVDGGGRVHALELVRSSGSAELDRRVKAAAATPLPAWPAPLRDRADQMVVVLRVPDL